MTAVEWLEKELNEKGKLTPVDFYQAKEMEEEQSISFVIDVYTEHREQEHEPIHLIAKHLWDYGVD